MERDKYLEFGGMDTSLYTSEDTDLFNRIINKGYKLFYSPKVLAYHRDRGILLFFIQRYVRGTQTTDSIKLYLGKLLNKQIIKKGEFRFEYIITPFLSIYIIYYIISELFFNIRYYDTIPLYLFFMIVFIESARLTKFSFNIFSVYLTLIIVSIIQSIASLSTFFNLQLNIKKIYRNENDI